ncbi:MAG TPA: 3-keto-5-aminohexanoate cleavage protein [Candidatus Dormibacteraeota bacterium]|nr:3-keto-5-aminohexanoate cleavage protein [Candidatus Dormibacteraeota bacterium]
MQPLIITVAPTGAEVRPEESPHLPYTADALGATAAACRAAGASMIHVHGRFADGRPTQDVETFRAFSSAVRANSDLIVQFSTGGAVGMTPEERAVALELCPEMATLTCGTVNFGEEVFENSFPIMRAILARMRAYGVVPELEIFDLGHLDNARRLEREGLLTFPHHVDVVLGVPGGAEASVENLVDIVRRLPAGCSWSVAGVGRAQLQLAAVAIAMGGHVRVGLEDNLYYAKGQPARNEELVARVARLAGELQRPVATPAHAREILGLRRAAQVRGVATKASERTDVR